MPGAPTRRAGKWAAVAFTPAVLGSAVLLGSCGGEATDQALGTVFTVAPTTYAVIDPPTTTTTTTTTLPPLPDVEGVDASSGTYTVSGGDSVYAIANKFGLTPEQLAAINGWADGIGHTILPGDVISVVAGASATPAAPGAPATGGDQQVATGTDAPQADCPTTYTITASDTTRIKVASRFGITYQEMDAANTGTPGYGNFLIGTVINIPCPV
jgi:LysM repeat protein